MPRNCREMKSTNSLLSAPLLNCGARREVRFAHSRSRFAVGGCNDTYDTAQLEGSARWQRLRGRSVRRWHENWRAERGGRHHSRSKVCSAALASPSVHAGRFCKASESSERVSIYTVKTKSFGDPVRVAVLSPYGNAEEGTTMRHFQCDLTRSLLADPTWGHNRWHPDIAPY